MQDPDNARISSCALPYLVFAPAGFILLITFSYLLSPLIQRWRPNWTIPFITDQDEDQGASEEPFEGKQPIRWTLALLTCSSVGFSAEVVNCFPPNIDFQSIIFVASWVNRHPPQTQALLTRARLQ